MKALYNVGVGVAAFVFDGDKCILQLRTGAHGASTWAPPGGKLDYGETPDQGLAREIIEETSLKIKDITFVGYTNDIFKSDGLHYITLWFAARVASGTAKITEPHKCLEQRWVTLNDLPKPLFLPTYNILKDPVALAKLVTYSKAKIQ